MHMQRSSFFHSPYTTTMLTVNEWIWHKLSTCHSWFCCNLKELSHSDLCAGVTLGSGCVTDMSHRCLESQLCSITHSLQTLLHTFTHRSQRPIHTEERKGMGCFSRRGILPSSSLSLLFSCPSPLIFSLCLYFAMSPPPSSSSTCNLSVIDTIFLLFCYS